MSLCYYYLIYSRQYEDKLSFSSPQCLDSCCSSVGSGGPHVHSAWWKQSSVPLRHTVKCHCLQHRPPPQSSHRAAGNEKEKQQEKLWTNNDKVNFF